MEAQPQPQIQAPAREPTPRHCGFCRQPGHTIGFCSSDGAYAVYNNLCQSLEIIRQLPNTNIEYQANRFKNWLLNNHSAAQIKLLALRFFNYQSMNPNVRLAHNMLAHATFIVDRLFDPALRQPLRQEEESIATLQRISSENIRRRREIRSQREQFDRETRRYNALRQSYQANVNAYNEHLRTNSGVEIAAIRQHALHLPNGNLILSHFNDSLASAGNDAQRNSVIGNTMQEIQAAVVERERLNARANAQRIQEEGEQAILTNLRRQREMTKIVTTILCTETAAELQQHQDCPICYSDETKLMDMISTNCNHEFCKTCICRHIDGAPANRRACCPMCRADIRSLVVRDVEFCQELNNKYNRVVT